MKEELVAKIHEIHYRALLEENEKRTVAVQQVSCCKVVQDAVYYIAADSPTTLRLSRYTKSTTTYGIVRGDTCKPFVIIYK